MAGILILTLLALGLLAGLLLARGGWTARSERRRAVAPWSPRAARPGTAAAERLALDLLRSVVNAEEWAMFRELGFICVRGRRRATGGPGRYRYLLYPHRPVVALLPGSLTPVREYCIQFPDAAHGRADSLPVGDDLLAKWMTLRGDEDRLLSFSNVATVGSEVPLDLVERDLGRLRRWHAARDDPFSNVLEVSPGRRR